MYHGQNLSRKECEVFDDSTLREVQGMAQVGLTRNEILDGYSISWDDLPETDQKAFTEHYNYGRVCGLKQMSESLFLQARSKQGTAASLAYLARFAAEWKKEVDTATGDTNFVFNMKM